MQQLTASGYRPGIDPELEYFREADKEYFDEDGNWTRRTRGFPDILDPRNPNLRPPEVTPESMRRAAEAAALEEALAMAEMTEAQKAAQKALWQRQTYGDRWDRTGQVSPPLGGPRPGGISRESLEVPADHAQTLQREIDRLTKGTRAPTAEEQFTADQLQEELDRMGATNGAAIACGSTVA
jgi:hypothetical protein